MIMKFWKRKKKKKILVGFDNTIQLTTSETDKKSVKSDMESVITEQNWFSYNGGYILSTEMESLSYEEMYEWKEMKE